MDRAPGGDPTDTDLVRRARRGDAAAFEAIYRAHARAIHGMALRLTGQPALAEDITQDTFLRLLRFLGGFRAGAPLRPWLKRVAANLAIDHLRRDRTVAVDPTVQNWADPGNGPDIGAEAEGVLRRLPPVLRTVVWLHEVEGWTHPELARRFGRTPSWSKSILSRGLAAMRGDPGTGGRDAEGGDDE
jgi:RNA polymerase sigma-70 factor (ECF subfamily)